MSDFLKDGHHIVKIVPILEVVRGDVIWNGGRWQTFCAVRFERKYWHVFTTDQGTYREFLQSHDDLMVRVTE